MQESWMLAHSKEPECTASPRGPNPSYSGHSALTSSLHSPMSKGSSWSYLNQHKYITTSWQTPVALRVPSYLILLGRRLERSSGNEHSLKGDSETWYHFADGRLVRSTGTTRSRHDKQLPDWLVNSIQPDFMGKQKLDKTTGNNVIRSLQHEITKSQTTH